MVTIITIITLNRKNLGTTDFSSAPLASTLRLP